MDYYIVLGESKTLIFLILQKLQISAGSMSHLARKGFSLQQFINGVVVGAVGKIPVPRTQGSKFDP